MSDVSIAIMAGGKSSRMGQDKAFVEILGKPIIEQIIDRVSQLGQTFIITNRPNEYASLDLSMFSDVLPNKGSLGGIYTALHHSPTHHTLVLACDMPFVNTEFLHFMLDLRADNDVVVPCIEGYPQGLHAIYSKNCLAPIRQKLDQDQLKVISFYDEVRVRYLHEPEYHAFDPQGYALLNINTPEELAEARYLAGDHST